MKSYKWFGCPTLLCGGLLVVLMLFWVDAFRVNEQADDAYITYRYAVNLATGHGLVFNVGERVEGYTNLLWALLVAVGVYCGATAPQVGKILAISGGTIFLILAFSYAASFLRAERKALALFAPLLLLASNAFIHWTTSGLETPLFGAFVVGALLAYRLEKIWLVSCLTVCAALTRPDGVVLAAVLLGWNWLQAIRALPSFSVREALRASGPALFFAGYLVLHTIFRLWYYDAPLPNTFYAKVGGIPVSRGVTYVFESLADGAFAWCLLALCAAVLFRSFRLAFFVSLVYLAYIIKIGGDVFPIGRFLVHLYPIWLVGVVLVLDCAWDNARKFAVLILGVVLASFYWSLYVVWPGSTDFEHVEKKPFPALVKRERSLNHTDFMITEASLREWYGRAKDAYPGLGSIAAIGIGKLGYVAMDAYLLDMVGLVDRHIARSQKIVPAPLVLPGHQRTDAEYVLSKEPDMIWVPRVGENPSFALPCVVDMWGNAKLQDRYDWSEDLRVWVKK